MHPYCSHTNSKNVSYHTAGVNPATELVKEKNPSGLQRPWAEGYPVGTLCKRSHSAWLPQSAVNPAPESGEKGKNILLILTTKEISTLNCCERCQNAKKLHIGNRSLTKSVFDERLVSISLDYFRSNGEMHLHWRAATIMATTACA